MTVARLVEEMPMAEMLIWRVKWATDPWGEHRADLRNAMLCLLLQNIHRDPKKNPKGFTDLTPFLLFKRDDPDAKDPDEMPRRATIQPETVAWFYAIAAQHEKNPPAPLKRKQPKGETNGA